MSQRIAVFGTGYVGLVTGAVFASLGHRVTCVDIDAQRIARLQQGDLPLIENGLPQMVASAREEGLLEFTTDGRKAVRDAAFAFICVGTPSLPTGAADLRQVRSAAEMIAQGMRAPLIVVNKSTVPVGTGDRVEQWVAAAQPKPVPFDVVSNPEFLREGNAVHDSLHPERIVIGAQRQQAAEAVGALYGGIDAPRLYYDRRTAEMIKYASNAFLATKISFINEIASICERVGADVTQVAEAMGYDHRIGSSFLNAGIGYGGSCFPKDTSALIQIAGNVYYDFKLLKAVVDVNERSRMHAVEKLERALGGLEDKRIAVFGLSFKPNTDDIRESPALIVIPALLDRGARVVATDPAATERARSFFAALLAVPGVHEEVLPDSLRLVTDPYEAVLGCDAVLLLTEWSIFTTLDWERLASLLRGDVVLDGRNALDPATVAAAGLHYIGIGRPDKMPQVTETLPRSENA